MTGSCRSYAAALLATSKSRFCVMRVAAMTPSRCSRDHELPNRARQRPHRSPRQQHPACTRSRPTRARTMPSWPPPPDARGKPAATAIGPRNGASRQRRRSSPARPPSPRKAPGSFTNADFRTGTSAPGSGEFEVKLTAAPPGNGGVGGQVGVAQDRRVGAVDLDGDAGAVADDLAGGVQEQQATSVACSATPRTSSLWYAGSRSRDLNDHAAWRRSQSHSAFCRRVTYWQTGRRLRTSASAAGRAAPIGDLVRAVGCEIAARNNLRAEIIGLRRASRCRAPATGLQRRTGSPRRRF